jgi:hypothetical protein
MSTAKQPLAKQVLYVDVDDEITAIIDKMSSADAKVVALVLPKRAAVFQSVVNMKLLKRRADAAKKHIVLITSETGLMPLAGLAGVHVAPTLQSKPEIPLSSAVDDDDEEDDSELSHDDFDADDNAATPVGALAGAAPAAINRASVPDDEVIELDNTAPAKAAAAAKSGRTPAAAGAKPASKNRKLQVPNFLRFRKRLLLAGLALILLIVGWYFAFFVMPKATVTIKTNSTDINTRLAMTLNTSANDVDTDKLVVPAETKQEQKSNTQSVPATGQQNKGEKAVGNVTLTSSVCGTPSTPPDVPAGTGISTNGLTFLTQENASFTYAGIDNGCIRFRSGSVAIAAQKGGAQYNVSGAAFTVAGRSDVSGNGTASGGTDNNVKVVQQSDIDGAKQKLTSAQDQTAIKRQLQERLEDDGLYALPATFNASTPNITTSSNVDEEADNVTVTQAITYTMFGVKKDNLKKLVEASVEDKIDKSKQSIIDDGLAGARYSVETPSAGPQLKLDATLTATAGPKIDVNSLKQQIAGMKSGQVKDRVRTDAGVQDVQVKYSPFWVTKAPKADKITVQFEKSSGGTTQGTNGSQDN